MWVAAQDYDSWRRIARRLLAGQVPPDRVAWHDGDSVLDLAKQSLPAAGITVFHVPPAFVELATSVACHRDPTRWGLLYAALWRLVQGEKHFLHLATDPVMHRLRAMEKAVRRDAHKAKAFVRFRQCVEDGEEHYVAWHRPDHKILRLVAPFFQRRFAAMHWTILTDEESVHWDGKALRYGPGAPASAAPQDDVLEDMWRAYYRATFNPARIKLKAMRREMPVRHWATLPETQIIGDMLREAPDRVTAMLAHQEGLSTSALDALPPGLCGNAGDLPRLRAANFVCQACPLHCGTTQAVFGEGANDARLMLVGEQPGEEEDRLGRPFVGPAGQVLDRALDEAGIDRRALYVTNAVKHFKHTRRFDRAYHRNPDARDINACKPWLQAELDAVQPQFVLCLGVSAARSIIGHGFTLKTGHGQVYDIDGRQVRATYHPAAILREPHELKRREMHQSLITDLILVKRALAEQQQVG